MHIIANKLNKGKNTASSVADISDIRSELNRKLAKSRKLLNNNNTMEESKFLNFDTKNTIFQHLNSKCHIWTETNELAYEIGNILSLLTFDQLISEFSFILSKSNFGQ